MFLKVQKKTQNWNYLLRAAHKGPSRNLKTIPKEKKRKIMLNYRNNSKKCKNSSFEILQDQNS